MTLRAVALAHVQGRDVALPLDLSATARAADATTVEVPRAIEPAWREAARDAATLADALAGAPHAYVFMWTPDVPVDGLSLGLPASVLATAAAVGATPLAGAAAFGMLHEPDGWFAAGNPAAARVTLLALRDATRIVSPFAAGEVAPDDRRLVEARTLADALRALAPDAWRAVRGRWYESRGTPRFPREARRVPEADGTWTVAWPYRPRWATSPEGHVAFHGRGTVALRKAVGTTEAIARTLAVHGALPAEEIQRLAAERARGGIA